MKGNYEANWKKAVKEIKRLEKRNERLVEEGAEKDRRLVEQAAEAGVMGRASMEVHHEDGEQLADYKDTNTKLLKFVEKVAKSKSKFGKEAREVLGY